MHNFFPNTLVCFFGRSEVVLSSALVWCLASHRVWGWRGVSGRARQWGVGFSGVRVAACTLHGAGTKEKTQNAAMTRGDHMYEMSCMHKFLQTMGGGGTRWRCAHMYSMMFGDFGIPSKVFETPKSISYVLPTTCLTNVLPSPGLGDEC